MTRTSQNGWPVLTEDETRLWLVPLPGADRTFRAQSTHAGFVLVVFALWYHENVEPINTGVWDEWGWNDRDIRGSTQVSNHASGTAIDLNATKHPLGRHGTFNTLQYVRLRAHVLSQGNVLRGGYSYAHRPDEMHWEINVVPSSGKVVSLASKVAKAPRGIKILAANPGYHAPVSYVPGERGLSVGMNGGDVQFVQRKVGVPVDGHYGDKTAAAVKRWETAHKRDFPGLKVDGVVGKITWATFGVKVKY